LSRLTPEIVSHALALIVSVALAGVIFMQKSATTAPASLTNPAIQIALEPEPAAVPQPAEQPRPAPEPPPRAAPRRDHHDAKAAPPLMAEVAATTPAAAGEIAPDAEPNADDAPPLVAAVPAGTLEAQYAATLRTNIDSRTAVPNSMEYRLRKPQGEARVSFTRDRGGSMLESALAKSSGSGMLDRQAINIVQTGRYPPFPDAAFRGESRHSFIVTLEFHL
jgi:periplasmic protein TonB